MERYKRTILTGRAPHDTKIEELQAIRKILIEAGLLVEIRDRELIVFEKVRDGS